MDYYAPHPTVLPKRPIALVGLPGARVEETAKVLSLLVGLPWVSLDRAVEHRAGKSLDRILLQDGEAARTALERTVLPGVLAAPLPHVIALSDTTLTDAELTATALGAEIVLLDVPFVVLMQRLRQKVAAAPSHRWALLFGEPDPAVLRPVFEARLAAMRSVARVVPVGDRSPMRVARDLAAGLEQAGHGS